MAGREQGRRRGCYRAFSSEKPTRLLRKGEPSGRLKKRTRMCQRRTLTWLGMNSLSLISWTLPTNGEISNLSNAVRGNGNHSNVTYVPQPCKRQRQSRFLNPLATLDFQPSKKTAFDGQWTPCSARNYNQSRRLTRIFAAKKQTIINATYFFGHCEGTSLCLCASLESRLGGSLRWQTTTKGVST